MSLRPEFRIAHTPVDTDTPEQAANRLTLVNRLHSHDWYYQYADDYGAHEAGRASWAAIRQLAQQVPGGIDIIRAQEALLHR